MVSQRTAPFSSLIFKRRRRRSSTRTIITIRARVCVSISTTLLLLFFHLPSSLLRKSRTVGHVFSSLFFPPSSSSPASERLPLPSFLFQPSDRLLETNVCVCMHSFLCQRPANERTNQKRRRKKKPGANRSMKRRFPITLYVRWCTLSFKTYVNATVPKCYVIKYSPPPQTLIPLHRISS